MKIKERLFLTSQYSLPFIFRNHYFKKPLFQSYLIDNVRLEWQSPNGKNVGDYLSGVVVTSVLNEKKDLKKDAKKEKHLFAIGSIIGYNGFNATIWGTGILNLKLAALNVSRQISFRKYDIRCVRGPLTRNFLIGCGYNVPEKFGDPAVLMPLFYMPTTEKKTHEFGIIFHKRYQRILGNEYCISVDTDDYKKFIEEICSCKCIISSSLHGIILAESYNVPAILLCESEDEDLFKFYDYYFGTGRKNVVVAHSIEEAKKMKPMVLPNLERNRKDLLETFPYDLWQK